MIIELIASGESRRLRSLKRWPGAVIWKKLFRYYKKLQSYEDQLEKIQIDAKTRLHLGCGQKYKSGYVNVDAFSEVADIKTDIVGLDPFEDDSVDLIESHHVLEHLSFCEADIALSTWARKLKTSGYVIISVPDLNACCRLFLDSKDDARWGESGAIVQMIYGSQEHGGMFHKSGYTPEHLSTILAKKGLETRMILDDYPERPTPSFLILAQKSRGLMR